MARVRGDVETALAEVMTEISIADVPDDEVPAEIIAGLREQGYMIVDIAVIADSVDHFS